MKQAAARRKTPAQGQYGEGGAAVGAADAVVQSERGRSIVVVAGAGGGKLLKGGTDSHHHRHQPEKSHIEAVGGRLVDLTRRDPRGRDQVCPWDLVTAIAPTSEDRAAAAWVIADEIMLARTDLDTEAYELWCEATLADKKLVSGDRDHVLLYAAPVFEANDRTGVTGYIGEWLWYLSTRDLVPEPGRSVDFTKLDPQDLAAAS
ncbi:hypothetical protein ACFQ9Z_35185 [Streptomyces sp. NPDC056580]|uniref:hypothetical protein n=1 Tax=Streptomyces sp. NPDC056580 TaxID=3345872 RepID=UPI0036BFDB93